mgnify:CR=1 FL=1
MVFSLSVRAEGRRKRILGHRRLGNRRILEYLIRHTSTIAQASNVDVIWIDEKRQKGQRFGERFTNAFVDLFEQGYKKVISIGNDCPDLSPDIINKALTTLQQNTLVLGPTVDGGDYLIGVHREDFVAQDWEQLPWNTSGLHQAFLQLAEAGKMQVNCLDILADIDDQQSLLQYLKCSPRTVFTRFVINVFQENYRPARENMTHVRDFRLFSNHPLRAPPQ